MTAKNTPGKTRSAANDLQDIAENLVRARLAAAPLDEYPGTAPGDLQTAYRIQDFAIDLWPDAVSGWKVGRIPPELEQQFGCDRLAGPIFRKVVYHQVDGKVPDMPVFGDGFAAVEAEFVAVIRRDAAAGKLVWSREEAESMIGELRIGLEVASSPLAAINDLGPAVTASDFGNNAGLIVGPAISNWQSRDPATLTSETFVDDQPTGTGGAFRLTGGVTRSVQFMLELAASRGRPLHAGDVIATGQTSGIHQVTPGQVARIDFGPHGELTCKLIAATPRPGAD
jgi:2-keto-4-pentenoate hydratase